jgi:hypothetical protein
VRTWRGLVRYPVVYPLLHLGRMADAPRGRIPTTSGSTAVRVCRAWSCLRCGPSGCPRDESSECSWVLLRLCEPARGYHALVTSGSVTVIRPQSPVSSHVVSAVLTRLKVSIWPWSGTPVASMAGGA